MEKRSVKSQMRLAHKERYRYALILGDEELTAGMATVKDMAQGGQERVPLPEVVERLTGWEHREKQKEA
jgi:histidyl-tRNA synthetase